MFSESLLGVALFLGSFVSHPKGLKGGGAQPGDAFLGMFGSLKVWTVIEHLLVQDNFMVPAPWFHPFSVIIAASVAARPLGRVTNISTLTCCL